MMWTSRDGQHDGPCWRPGTYWTCSWSSVALNSWSHQITGELEAYKKKSGQCVVFWSFPDAGCVRRGLIRAVRDGAENGPSAYRKRSRVKCVCCGQAKTEWNGSDLLQVVAAWWHRRRTWKLWSMTVGVCLGWFLQLHQHLLPRFIFS